MPITLVFLGKLADLAGAPEQQIEGPVDWSGLLAAVPDPVAEMAKGERVKLALNGRVLPDKTTLSAQDGDEIALLPPVSGG